MLRWTTLFSNRLFSSQLAKGVRRKRRKETGLARRLAVETLEDRRMLAVAWVNRGSTGSDTDMFGAVYGTMAEVARENINRAISIWDEVITDFNYDGDNNPATDNVFSLTVIAADLGGGSRGLANTIVTDVNDLPISGMVTMDDAGGNGGWYIDPMPFDDGEFFSIVNPFQADSTQTGNDFLRTALHEIGHTLGILTGSGLAINNFFTGAGTDQVSGVDNLNVFQNLAGQFGVFVTLTDNGGGHIYEGPVDPGFLGAPTHPNELMNPGRTVGPPATRQLVTDLDAMLLADAYGYTVQLPSELPIVFIEEDALEENNTRQTATFLGSDPFVSIQNLSVFDADDEDFFEIRANQTGKMVIHIDFAHSNLGNLDLQVLDSLGNLIASSTSVTDDEELVIPVVAQEAYFLRVFGVGDDINNYSLEIENLPAPIPTGIHLDPASDLGRLNNDELTSDDTPTLIIQTDVLGFVDANRNNVAEAGEIDVLTAAEAAAGNVPGIAVEVTLINTTDPAQAPVVAFADPLIPTFPTIYTFTPAAPLADGVYFATARTVIIDGQTPNELGRSDVSAALVYHRHAQAQCLLRRRGHCQRRARSVQRLKRRY